MAYYPIMSKQDRLEEAIEKRKMPIFYMQDYTVMGFRVNDCDLALEVLDRHAFSVRRGHGSKGVDIENPARVYAVVELLEASGLECEIADIAEGIYQG